MTDGWVGAKRLLDAFDAEIGNPDIAFLVHYWGVTPAHRDNPVHRHSFFEVCYVVDGEGTYAEGGLEYPLRPGTMFCSRPGVQHQIRSRGGMYLLYVAFETVEAKTGPVVCRRLEGLKRSGRVAIAECQGSPSVLLWRALLDMASSGKAVREALASAIHALLVSFLSEFGEEESEERRHMPLNPNERHVKRAVLYIRNNLSARLRLRDLAEYLHISGRHLSRLFSDSLGMSYTEYVRNERLRQAAELLVSSDMPLKEIARETGFQTIHYFTRAFCECKGMPPGKYRETGRATQNDGGLEAWDS
ncbi:helix-turn-helix domain-containing protein [Paenibacillus hemerocallicola]|uniref:Helix-turn-helix domain-containing protein n=1 Tax=Paenibacillus hemerocallicola TaxID=1172614 RepID=A0A5C4T588_9BACL|nr:AraC family transcriptional regulator [Paenibacillus hemerocallicola]TNJ64198.1 helix-turn-helix domain-containing protein [Paenibacillus hemerocallicola]